MDALAIHAVELLDHPLALTAAGLFLFVVILRVARTAITAIAGVLIAGLAAFGVYKAWFPSLPSDPTALVTRATETTKLPHLPRQTQPEAGPRQAKQAPRPTSAPQIGAWVERLQRDHVAPTIHTLRSEAEPLLAAAQSLSEADYTDVFQDPGTWFKPYLGARASYSTRVIGQGEGPPGLRFYRHGHTAPDNPLRGYAAERPLELPE